MLPATAIRYLPYGVLALGGLAYALFLRAAVGRGLGRRAVLLALTIAGGLPALYVGLVWAGALPDSYLRFARPWTAVLGLFATALIAWRLLGARVRHHPWRTRLGDVLAPLAALAAAMAAAGPEVGRPLDRLTVLVAVDRSRSIDLVPNAHARMERELQVAELAMRDDDRIGTIAFGADAATEDPPRPRSSLPAPQRVSVGRDGTDIAAAIRRALAEVPADSAARIVVASDGVATRGDTVAAAAAAVAADLPVDVLAFEQRVVPDVRVVAVRAPTRADEGERFDLKLVTSAPTSAEVEIRLLRNGRLESQTTATIGAGEDMLRIRETAPGPGLHRYDVQISALDPALDQAAEDNHGSVFVRVRGSAAALVLEGDEGQGTFIAQALRDAAFRVDEGSASAMPDDVGGMAGYDLIVVSDIRAPALSPGQIDALASYVRDLGGGLLLMGGDRSMGPGGYSRTPLEEISPVSFDLKQERRRGSLAEVIGIDISGSMGARVGVQTKLELANEAAARSAALLGPGDLLGVEHVDTTVRWSVPLGPVADKAAIDRKIRAVGPGGGGIFVDITLEAAYAALDREKVNLRHVLLFADGSDAEQMGPNVRALVADAFRRQITTSVIALGTGSDVPELELLSRLGSGRFYLIEDAARLPAVFAQETILAARSAIVEKDFHVAPGAASSALVGIDLAGAPSLKGYVVTIPKSRATVLLKGPEDDPILAVWAAGLGRCAAFTSDLKDRWGAAWTRFPGAARMVAQIARDVSRKGEDSRVRIEADAAGGQLHVRATVVGDDGRAQSFRRLVVHVAGADGFGRDVPLEASGAGAYTATVPLSRPGTYIAVARDEISGEAVGMTGAVLTAGEELRPTGSDLALLGRIAHLTGGKKRSTLAGIFDDRAARRFAYDDATKPLLTLAAFGLVLAVAARRFALPEPVLAWSARLRARVAGRRPRQRARPPQPEATVSALLDARDRTRRGLDARKDGTAHGSSEAGWRPLEPAELGGRQLVTMPSRPAPVTAPVPSSQPVVGRARLGANTDATPPSQRPLTAAEILLARRRGRNGSSSGA